MQPMNLWQHPKHQTCHTRFECSRKFPNGKLHSPKTKNRGKAKDIFKALAGVCKINVRFHNLRHIPVTYMIKNSIPLEIIQKILGHSDIRTTQIYAQVYDDVIQKEMSKLKY